MKRILIAVVGIAAAGMIAGCVVPVYAPPARTAASPAPPTGAEEVVLSPGQGTEVLAEGVAALPSRGGVDIARDHALDDALRKAVEQGVGTFISSETKVENFQLLSDRIYSQSTGYVSSYKVITEGLEGALYRVVIRTKVKTEDIENDLAAIGILVLEQGRPRIMVVVKELGGSADIVVDDRLMSQTMVETMILDGFRQKGFPVVDAATVRLNLEKQQLKRMLEGDNKAAVLVGLKSGAEVIVTGTAARSSKSVFVAGMQRRFYRFQMSARAINTETGEVLGASATSTELPFSEDEARRRAADTTSAELISDILSGWKKHENVTLIEATNADFAKVQKLAAEIRLKLRGIIEVVSRDLVGTTATIEVISETSSREVRDGLDTRGLDVEFEIEGFSGNRIEIRF